MVAAVRTRQKRIAYLEQIAVIVARGVGAIGNGLKPSVATWIACGMVKIASLRIGAEYTRQKLRVADSVVKVAGGQVILICAMVRVPSVFRGAENRRAVCLPTLHARNAARATSLRAARCLSRSLSA